MNFRVFSLFQAKKVVKNRASRSYKSSLRSSESIFFLVLLKKVTEAWKAVRNVDFWQVFRFFFEFQKLSSFYYGSAPVNRRPDFGFWLENTWSLPRFFLFCEKYFSPPKVTNKPLWPFQKKFFWTKFFFNFQFVITCQVFIILSSYS